MPVTFVIGPAGSGKTYRCLERIEREAKASPLGPPIWLIVPKQATFQNERELAARLGAFTRIRVVSPSELGETILQEVGKVPIAQVTAAGRGMVIGRLLYRYHDQLQYFASSARRPGLARSIDGMFDEFERSGHTLDELGDLIDQIGHAEKGRDGSPSLHAKLADLRLLYTKYTDYLGQDRLDPQGRRRAVLQRLAHSESLRHATVYVDGFLEFADHERRLLGALGNLAAAVEINITLPADSPVLQNGTFVPDDLSPFLPVELSYARLRQAINEAGAAITAHVLMSEPKRFVAEPLRRIERRLFRPAAEAISPPSSTPDDPDANSLLFLEAPDPRVEVQAVARRIRDLLAAGYRQREILVLCRTTEDYLHIIHSAFAEHGLTYFADRRRLATHHPLIRLLRSAVRIARDGFTTAAVTALCKTGMAGVSDDEADALENFLLERRITPEIWLNEGDWNFDPRQTEMTDEFDLSAAPADDQRVPMAVRDTLRERLSPLAEMLGRSAPTAALKRFATETLAALEGFGVRKTLAQWIQEDRRDNPEQAEEHEQVWAQLAELFAQMVDVLGDQHIAPGEYIEILESGLDDFDLAITPATIDQVLVGGIDRTRPPSGVKAVFVLGLCRGGFPIIHREASLLSTPERRELQRNRIDVEPDVQRRLLDERFLAYYAFTRASHRLIVSRPMADERGKELEPSDFWTELRAIVPEAPLISEHPCIGDAPDCLSTPRDLVSSLLNWARALQQSRKPAAATAADATGDTNDSWRKALYNWIALRSAVSAGEANATDRLVVRAWPSLGYDNAALLSKASAAALFPSPLVVSAGELESFAACPFQHFVSYGLRPARRGGGDISALELSQIYHETLESMVLHAIGQKAEFASLPPDELARMAREAVPEIARQLRGQVALEEARSAYILDRVSRTLDMILATLREQLGRGDFAPFRAGVAFGPNAKLESPAIPISGGGGAVRLRGRIDRVDCTPDGQLALHDYRMGEQRLAPASVYYGHSLRLLTCLLVLDRAGLTYRGKQLAPAAALSARLLRSLQNVKHPDEAADPTSPEFRLSAKPRGVVASSYVHLFDHETKSGMSPVLAYSINKDGTFGRREYSDLADDEEFRTLINFVEHKVADLAGQIVVGRVAVEPYLYNNASPCVRCDYRSICRFEPGVNHYRVLGRLSRSEALDQMRRDVAKTEAGDAR